MIFHAILQLSTALQEVAPWRSWACVQLASDEPWTDVLPEEKRKPPATLPSDSMPAIGADIPENELLGMQEQTDLVDL